MASYLDKQIVPTAQEPRNKFDLSHTHITSGDFFETGVSWIHEMTPGAKIDVDLETFARAEAMPTPTFGRARIVTRAFAVPMRLVYPAWEEFMADTVNIPADNDLGALHSKCPYFTNNELCDAFTDSSGGAFDSPAMVYETSNSTYDLEFGGRRWNYTFYGRQAIKLLRQLGYAPVFGISKDYDFDLNAMPLLALGRVFAEYYYPAQYHDYQAYDRLMRLCKVNLSTMTTGIHLSSSDIRTILNIVSWSYHDSNIWVNAWDTPNQPSVGLHTDFKLRNIDSIGSLTYKPTSSATYSATDVQSGYVTNNSGSVSSDNRIGGADAPFISPYVNAKSSGQDVTPSVPISAFLLESLYALSDFMKRNQMSGSRAAERLLARYGLPVPSMRYNRSQYLGAYSQDVQIGDVMSTSSTGSASLGDYAGKAISAGSGKFSYETNEFCYLIFITTILPQDGTGVQGVHPQVLRLYKNSFFQPEFDRMGTEPLESLTLYAPKGSNTLFQGIGTQIFGFIPRFGTYKYERDAISGLYELPSVQSAVPGGSPIDFAENSWNLYRLFDNQDFPNGNTDMVHSLDFMSGKADCLDYKRIFYANDPDAPDSFRLVFNFQVAEWDYFKPLYDTYDFHNKGNKNVTMEVNGVKAN